MAEKAMGVFFILRVWPLHRAAILRKNNGV